MGVFPLNNLYIRLSSTVTCCVLVDNYVAAYYELDYNQRLLDYIYSKFVNVPLDSITYIVSGTLSTKKFSDCYTAFKISSKETYYCNMPTADINPLIHLAKVLGVGDVKFVDNYFIIDSIKVHDSVVISPTPIGYCVYTFLNRLESIQYCHPTSLERTLKEIYDKYGISNYVNADSFVNEKYLDMVVNQMNFDFERIKPRMSAIMLVANSKKIPYTLDISGIDYMKIKTESKFYDAPPINEDPVEDTISNPITSSIPEVAIPEIVVQSVEAAVNGEAATLLEESAELDNSLMEMLGDATVSPELPQDYIEDEFENSTVIPESVSYSELEETEEADEADIMESESTNDSDDFDLVDAEADSKEESNEPDSSEDEKIDDEEDFDFDFSDDSAECLDATSNAEKDEFDSLDIENEEEESNTDSLVEEEVEEEENDSLVEEGERDTLNYLETTLSDENEEVAQVNTEDISPSEDSTISAFSDSIDDMFNDFVAEQETESETSLESENSDVDNDNNIKAHEVELDAITPESTYSVDDTDEGLSPVDYEYLTENGQKYDMQPQSDEEDLSELELRAKRRAESIKDLAQRVSQGSDQDDTSDIIKITSNHDNVLLNIFTIFSITAAILAIIITVWVKITLPASVSAMEIHFDNLNKDVSASNYLKSANYGLDKSFTDTLNKVSEIETETYYVSAINYYQDYTEIVYRMSSEEELNEVKTKLESVFNIESASIDTDSENDAFKYIGRFKIV